MGPGKFPLAHRIELNGDLGSILEAVAREGGVRETLSLLDSTQELAEGGGSEAEIEALREIVRDETRHALLAWDTLRWGVKRQPELVRSLTLT